MFSTVSIVIFVFSKIEKDKTILFILTSDSNISPSVVAPMIFAFGFSFNIKLEISSNNSLTLNLIL